MNIVFNDNDFKIENVFFLEKKRNVVIDGVFSKLLYSNELLTMNGLFFTIPLLIKTVNETQTQYVDKQYVSFNSHLEHNLLYITKLSEIENSIINYYKAIHCINKRNNLVLTNQLYNGYFKLQKEHKRPTPMNVENRKYMLKVSGLWENQNEVGITYKFIEVYDQ